MQKVRELSGGGGGGRPCLAQPSPCPEAGEASAGGAAGQPSPQGLPGRVLPVWGRPPGKCSSPGAGGKPDCPRLPLGSPRSSSVNLAQEQSSECNCSLSACGSRECDGDCAAAWGPSDFRACTGASSAQTASPRRLPASDHPRPWSSAQCRLPGGASAEPPDKASCPLTWAPGVPVSYLSSLPPADGGVQAVSALTPAHASEGLRRCQRNSVGLGAGRPVS